MQFPLKSLAALLCLATGAQAVDGVLEALARAPIVDEIAIATADPGHRFTALPAGSSAIASTTGFPARVLVADPGPHMFCVRLGEGKTLVAGATYCLEVDYPEDVPRSFFIINRGDDTLHGISTGPSLPDALYQFTQSNPESLAIPLTNHIRTWRSIFQLHDRTGGLQRNRDGLKFPLVPADGFWVQIAIPEQRKFPGSAGAAVTALRLRHIADANALRVDIRRPPKELPWRHAFYREEMADGVIAANDELGKIAERGVANRVAWFGYKLQTMSLLGIDVFCKDLLEFGHNQGWDSAPYGGSDWVNQTNYPDMWAQIVDLVGKAGVAILPYYEYAGSVGQKTGLGSARRTRPLGDQRDYTHISWLEAHSVDLSDPDAVIDFNKITDLTMLAFKDRAKFLGLWMRPRPSAQPISFADATLARFAAATGKAATREQLRADPALLKAYYDWWFLERRTFLSAIRDHVRQGGIADATVLYTAYPGEPTPSLPGDPVVVSGDLAPWSTVFAGAGHKPRPIVSWKDATADRRYADILLAQPSTWDNWEWQHSAPQADPQNYRDTDGIVMTYPYNRAYTVAVPEGMDAFRSPSGLAMVRHQVLNEEIMPREFIGYHCIDMERSGPACMLSEVMAVANGDPRWMGVLAGTAMTTGYPEHVRDFYAAFLALPALPSTVMKQTPSIANLTVRAIDAGVHGTWLAIANTGFTPMASVQIQLPKAGKVTDAATGAALNTTGRTLSLDLPAVSLRAIHIAP